MSTHHLGNDLYLKPVVAKDERLWLLFDEGVSHPLVVLTDYQVDKIMEAIEQEAKEKK